MLEPHPAAEARQPFPAALQRVPVAIQRQQPPAGSQPFEHRLRLAETELAERFDRLVAVDLL